MAEARSGRPEPGVDEARPVAGVTVPGTGPTPTSTRTPTSTPTPGGDAAWGRVSLASVVAAFLRRDLAEAASYRAAFVLRSLWMMAALAGFFFFSRFLAAGGAVLPFDRYGDAGYLGFWLVGVTVGDLFESLVSTLSRRVREAQVHGTLEATLATPAPAGYVLIGACAADVLFAFGRLAVYGGAGMYVFDVHLGPVHAGSVAIATLLSLVAFGGLALVGAALTMTFRRIDPVSAVAGLAAVVIGGIYYPIDILPPVVARLAYAFPLAPSLEALRRSLFAAAAPSELLVELAALALFGAVVLPLGVWLLARALARAREDGSLSHY